MMVAMNTICWKEFDRKKQIEGGDVRYFSFNEWEIDFLVEKIRETNPEYSEIRILRAILSCCETIPAPHPKNEFYEYVLQKLINFN
ncbi:MAG: hypothetical protein RI922_1632 [Bacteroidota bacterium]|jgi:hypothetical protein